MDFTVLDEFSLWDENKGAGAVIVKDGERIASKHDREENEKFNSLCCNNEMLSYLIQNR